MYFPQASPAWDLAAKLKGVVRTPYGDLRLFPRHKAEKDKEVTDVAQRLNEQNGLGNPNLTGDPTPTTTPPRDPEQTDASPASKASTEYGTARSQSPAPGPGLRGQEPSAAGTPRTDPKTTVEELLAKMGAGGPTPRAAQPRPPPPPPPPPQAAGRPTPQRAAQQQPPPPPPPPQAAGGPPPPPPPQAAMNKAPPIPAPPMGKAPPPAKYSIPRRRSSSQPRPVPAVVVTPPQPNKQQKGKSTKAPKAATKGAAKGATKTKQSGETDAMRLQMEAYLKRPKGSDESSSSRSSGRTTRGSTKRVHSPGEPSKTKKKDEKPSPASAAATTPK